jgi:NitT/TauT family transport system substrate-binding protein
MRRRQLLQTSALFTLGALSTAALNGCNNQSNPTATSGSPSTKPLEIGLVPWIGWGRIHIAEAKGMFKESGLNIKHTEFQTVTDANTAFLSKKIDLCWLVATDLIVLTNQVPGMKMVQVADFSGEVDTILGHGINSPADLKGKKLAREDAPYEIVFVERYLQSIGLTTKDVEIISLPGPDAAAAFAAGKVDAAAIYEPFVTKARQERSGSTVLFTAKDSNVIANGLAGHADALTRRREEILTYLRVLDKAMKYAEVNPKECNELIAQWTGSKPEEIAAQLKQVNMLDLAANKTTAFAAGHPLNLAASLDAAAAILVKAGKAPKIVAGKDLVDDSFVKAL